MVFALGAAAELVAVGVAALMVDRAGRHGTIAAGMLLCGVVSVACAVTHNNALQAAFATLGKFGCSGEWCVT
jgi:MFS family permease